MRINFRHVVKVILISLIATYLTVFIEYTMPPPPPYTDEFHSEKVLVGGLPYFFLEDNEGISPVKSLQNNPIDLLIGIDVFHWDKFLIDWCFWFGLIVSIFSLAHLLKQNLKVGESSNSM